MCSDLHGCYNLYKKIKHFVQHDDVIYNLGDSGDRGYEPYITLKCILNDEQFICIKGNHEDMLIDWITEYKRFCDSEDNFPSYSDACDLIKLNGGLDTIFQYRQEPIQEQNLLYEKLKSLPTHLELESNEKILLLSHAGYTPHLDSSGNLIFPEEEDLLWDRRHLGDRFFDDELSSYYVIHGHTINEFNSMIYCDNHKINLDMGTAFSGKCVLMNLDDFTEIHLFEE